MPFSVTDRCVLMHTRLHCNLVNMSMRHWPVRVKFGGTSVQPRQLGVCYHSGASEKAYTARGCRKPEWIVGKDYKRVLNVLSWFVPCTPWKVKVILTVRGNLMNFRIHSGNHISPSTVLNVSEARKLTLVKHYRTHSCFEWANHKLYSRVWAKEPWSWSHKIWVWITVSGLTLSKHYFSGF